MLGGLKAALGGRHTKSGPILPLSGEHVIRSNHHHPVEIYSDRSSTVVSMDEEAPRTRKVAPQLSQQSMTEVDSEVFRLRQEAGMSYFTSTLSSNGMAHAQAEEGLASPPQIPGGNAKIRAAAPLSGAPGGPGRPSGTMGLGDIKLGRTQLQINLDLDIFGPQGLLSQLGLDYQHELEDQQLLRVQCKGIEVHHSMRPTAEPTMAQVPENKQSLPGAIQQFYIGDDDRPDVDLRSQPQTFLSSSDGRSDVSGSSGYGAGTSTASRPPQRPKPTSQGALAALRSVAGGGSASSRRQKAQSTVGITGATSSNGLNYQDPTNPKQQLSSSAGALGANRKPARRRISGDMQIDSPEREADPSTLKEFEELRKKNLRLQSDLLDSLRAIEEDNISISTPDSTPSFTGTPRSTTSLGRSMGALLRGTLKAATTPNSTPTGQLTRRLPPSPEHGSHPPNRLLEPRVGVSDDDELTVAATEGSGRYSDAVSEHVLASR